MESNYDADKHQLVLAPDSGDEFDSFLAAARRESGFLVNLPTGLPLHQAVQVTVESGDRKIRFDANVAQVFDKGFGRFGTAFLVKEWPIETTAAPPAEPQPPRAAVEPGPSVGNPPAHTRADGEFQGISPMHRIKRMNPRQRAVLANKANRTERKILLQDKSPLVLQSLLNNPQLDTEDVLRIARSSHVVAPILQRIANDARWSSNQELLAVIARNPKTPTPFATRLLPSLRTNDVRSMARMSSGLKEMTRKAALREYMRRTGQRI